MHNADEILNSLDKIERAVAPDFFYASITAKMQRQRSRAARPQKFSFSPVYVTAALAVFLAVNIFVLTNYRSTASSSKEAGVGAFAREYNLYAQSFAQ